MYAPYPSVGAEVKGLKNIMQLSLLKNSSTACLCRPTHFNRIVPTPNIAHIPSEVTFQRRIRGWVGGGPCFLTEMAEEFRPMYIREDVKLLSPSVTYILF